MAKLSDYDVLKRVILCYMEAPMKEARRAIKKDDLETEPHHLADQVSNNSRLVLGGRSYAHLCIAEKMHAESRAMKWLTVWVAVMALANVVLVAVQVGRDPSPVPVTEIVQRDFKVLRVIDGDTFTVIYDGEETRVRLSGIDTPERGEPGFNEATAALAAMIEGRAVRLEFPAPRKRDSSGRLLCRVYAGDMDTGRELLRQGHAKPYKPK